MAPDGPDPLLERLAERWADGALPDLLDELVRVMEDHTAEWERTRTPSAVREAARLEAALALAQVALTPLEHDTLYRGRFQATLQRLLEAPGPIAATAPLAARLAWLCRETQGLAPLGAWAFVGPFDNERGRGMTRATPAEKDLDAPRYDGKLREVTWRTTPPLGPDGIVHVGRLVQNDEQACVLARTFVRMDAARDLEAFLLVGASEEVRAWWNGAPLFDALGEHEFAADAFTARVTLQSGWNELVLKVGAQDVGLAFSARLVDAATGAVLRPECAAERPAEAPVRKLEDPKRRIAPKALVPRPGALAFYAGRTDVEASVARAFVDHVGHTAPRKERPGAAAADAALAAAPDALVAHLAALATTRVPGALTIEEDVNPWLARLRAAQARFGLRPAFVRQYALHAWFDQGLALRALELVEAGLAANPSSVLLRWLRADLYDDLGQDALALRERRRLAAESETQRWPDLAVELLDVLPPAHPDRLALRAAAVAADHRGAVRRALLDERLARGSRDPEEVLATLAEDLALDPWDVLGRLGAAQKLLALGAIGEASAVLDEAVALAPEAPEVHQTRARAALAAGDQEAARAALRRVLELDLSAADEQRLLEHLEASEGETVPFHAAFQESLAEVLARRAADPPVADATAPREVLLFRTAIEAAPDGTSRRYYRIVERVLTEAGAKELDQRGFRVFPGEEEIRVLTADVQRTDGSIERARTGRTGMRGALTIDLPPLRPGDVVDLEWRHDDLRPSIFGSYVGLDARLAPDPRLLVRESEVIVLARPGVPLSFHVAGDLALSAGIAALEERLADGTLQRTWRAEGLAPRRSESLEPPPVEWQPRIQASTYANWQEFGRWWWNLIREEITVSPEMRDKVRELTADATTPLEKLRSIYDFVVTDIRYNAWEFGINGYRPYSAPVIFSRRFGDCKDKAILLRALLGVVDIEAWPVIIRAEGRRFEEDHTQALIAHFNHCIAYIPEQEGLPELFLDGTARLHPLEVLPDSDRGAKVLIVRDTGVDEVRIPFTTAGDNCLRERTVVDLTREPRPQVTLERRPTGRFDPRERQLFSGGEEERKATVKRLMSARFGALAGEASAEHPDYEDLGQPVTVVLEADVERIGREAGGGLELPSTFDPLRLLSTVATETERKTDLLLDVPWSTETELVHKLPPGTSLRTLPAPKSLGNEDLSYERTVEVQRGEGAVEVRIRERFELRTHRVPAARYSALRSLAREVDEAQRETVDVEVTK